MAIRNIRKFGDKVLTKQSKPVTEVNQKLITLINDMLDTMYEEGGAGLAAPQVGILKRLAVVDTSPEGDSPIILINPEIIEVSGEQTGGEGCLSLPGKVGIVKRPNYVKVRAQDINMEYFTVEGTELTARAFCHEIDHLNGVLYTDLMTGELMDSDVEEEEEL